MGRKKWWRELYLGYEASNEEIQTDFVRKEKGYRGSPWAERGPVFPGPPPKRYRKKFKPPFKRFYRLNPFKTFTGPRKKRGGVKRGYPEKKKKKTFKKRGGPR